MGISSIRGDGFYTLTLSGLFLSPALIEKLAYPLCVDGRAVPLLMRNLRTSTQTTYSGFTFRSMMTCLAVALDVVQATHKDTLSFPLLFSLPKLLDGSNSDQDAGHAGDAHACR